MKWFFCAVLLTVVFAGSSCFHGSAIGIENRSTSDVASDSSTTQAMGRIPLAADDDEKLTIKEIMKLAHKSGLLKKVATGKATEPEIADLHRYYLAMPTLTPPLGGKKSWKSKTEALVAASQAAIDKDPAASDLLKSATDCAACHEVHK